MKQLELELMLKDQKCNHTNNRVKNECTNCDGYKYTKCDNYEPVKDQREIYYYMDRIGIYW